MKIKRLQTADIEFALKIFRDLKSLPENKPLPEKDSIQTLLDNPCNIILAAQSTDGLPLGYITAYKLKMIYTTGYMLLLYEINIDSQHRSQGIGTALITELKRLCPAENIDRLWLVTNKSNARAVGLYKKMGLTTIGSEDDLQFTLFPEGSVLEENDGKGERGEQQ